MFILNHFMPVHRDDYDYSLIWMTMEHIDSFSDIIDSVYRHFLFHGGRLVTVFCLDLFLYLGKFWFDIANALMFMALVALIYLHACRKTTLSAEPGILAVTSVLAWLSFPHFGEVAIWKSGSTVYLWSAVMAFAFLLPYNLKLANRWKYNSLIFAAVMFIAGILAGWSVENLAVTVVCISVGSCWYCNKKSKTEIWQISGAIGAFLGIIGLLAAPGNFVRYNQQGTGKGILVHIGNQFAGNGEMILYILPMILLGVIVWRILKLKIFSERYKGKIVMGDTGLSFGQCLLIVFIGLCTVSYFSDGFIGNGIRDFLIQYVMVPLKLTRPKTIHLFTNLMSGFEEMAIYWFSVFFIFSAVKRSLGLVSDITKEINRRISAVEVLKEYPCVFYSIALFALALFNNFVMIAAPTFPVRATFSSVAIIIAGVVASLRHPVVIERLSNSSAKKVMCGAACFICTFIFCASVYIMHMMYEEDNLRVAMTIEAVKRGEKSVVFPQINFYHRALRHVYYEDFDNPVTCDGFSHYFGIDKVIVTKAK